MSIKRSVPDQSPEDTDFHNGLISCLPQLRVYALSLTRDPHRASDLVQDTVTRALAASSQFTPGTNLRAWLFTILRNENINHFRKRRGVHVTLDDMPALEGACVTPPSQEDCLVLKQVQTVLDELPKAQREALLLVVLQGMTYEEVAEVCGCAVGTIKSRVSRARTYMHKRVMGTDDETNVQVPSETESERQGAVTEQAASLS